MFSTIPPGRAPPLTDANRTRLPVSQKARFVGRMVERDPGVTGGCPIQPSGPGLGTTVKALSFLSYCFAQRVMTGVKSV
jgi:hypothetical protein